MWKIKKFKEMSRNAKTLKLNIIVLFLRISPNKLENYGLINFIRSIKMSVLSEVQ